MPVVAEISKQYAGISNKELVLTLLMKTEQVYYILPVVMDLYRSLKNYLVKELM